MLSVDPVDDRGICLGNGLVPSDIWTLPKHVLKVVCSYWPSVSLEYVIAIVYMGIWCTLMNPYMCENV